MTDEQRQRIHDITYSTDDRMELAERIVLLEEENAKLKNDNNYLHEMVSESRQANEHLYTELKRYKSILRTRPNAMTALYDENAKLRVERDEWHRVAVSKQDIIDHMRDARAENAKLRELVRDMFEEIEASGFDSLVERQGKRGPYYEEDSSWRVKIKERMRELGIEEDE